MLAVAGVALGLALMSKGPVALLESVVPIAIFLLWRRARWTREMIIAAIIGAIAMLAVAAPWFVLVALRFQVWKRWWIEVSRHGATENASGNPLYYFIVFALMLPWIVPLVGGLIDATRETIRRSDRRMVLALFLFAIPLIVMSFFPDRKDRYALPMLAPAAVIAGDAMATWLRRREANDNRAIAAHWIMLTILAVGVPVATTFLHAADVSPWLSGSQAIFAAAVGVGGMIIAWARWRGAVSIIIATVFVMIICHAVVIGGYARSAKGLSDFKPLAEAIVAQYPNALVYNGRGDDKRISVDLAIYLDRATIRDEHWRDLPPTDRPRVVVMWQRPNQPTPQPPAGWKFVDKSQRDSDWYWAFVQLPITPTTAPTTRPRRG
jgi:4-amino-4-deoxy-L-arabinose transferase-like glycosyltransferase